MNPEIQSFIESGEQITSGKEVSAEDLVRVQESEGKARQMAGQIAASQQQWGQLAKFLTKILQELYDEQWFWDHLVLFTISGHEAFNQTFLHEELIAMLLPFFASLGDEFEMQNFFPIDYHFTRTLANLTGYYVTLTGHYDRIGLMEREKMRKFLLVMLEHYGVIKMAEIENKSAVLAEIK
jgi:hypothetical protein